MISDRFVFFAPAPHSFLRRSIELVVKLEIRVLRVL